MNTRGSKYCTVEGKRIFYRERPGRSDTAAPVVLVHGNTASSLWFDGAMQIGDSRVVALDLPNFGRSDPIETSDIDAYALYTVGFIREVLGDRRFVLVGHSLGGAVAMAVAARLQTHVIGLMLVDSCPPGGLATPEEYYPVIEQYKSNRALLQQALASVTPHLADERRLEALVEEAMKMNPESFAGNARALARFDFSSRAAGVSVPVFVVRGADDVLITAEMAEDTVAAFPSGRLETIADVGHSMPVEDPPAFQLLVSRFVSEAM